MTVSWGMFLFIVAASFLIGDLVGTLFERRCWVLRAWRPGHHGAHFVDGKFFYVIEAGYFDKHYQMRVPHPLAAAAAKVGLPGPATLTDEAARRPSP